MNWPSNVSLMRSFVWIFPGLTAVSAMPSASTRASIADWFHAWNPKIIQYVSPQVWASRQSRVYQMAEDFDWS